MIDPSGITKNYTIQLFDILPCVDQLILQPTSTPTASPEPYDSPESGSIVGIFRELAGKEKRDEDRKYFSYPDTRPGEFRYDPPGDFSATGVSMFEFGHLPGVKPYVLGLVVITDSPTPDGNVEGFLAVLPICVARKDPPMAFPSGHWSVDCGNKSLTQLLLSNFAKSTYGKASIITNPFYGGPEERRFEWPIEKKQGANQSEKSDLSIITGE